MLEIRECTDTKKYTYIVEKINTDAPIHVTESFDGKKVSGYGIYAYSNDYVEIYDFDDGDDTALCDGIIRSILFKACMKGIDNAVFKINETDKLNKLKNLKFVNNSDKKLNLINDFMNNCKKCKEIK